MGYNYFCRGSKLILGYTEAESGRMIVGHLQEWCNAMPELLMRSFEILHTL